MKNHSHNIDLNAPGGIDRLFALHFKTFGSAKMMADGDPTPAPTPTPTPTSTPTPDPVPATTDADALGDPGKRALQAERDARSAEKVRADAAEAELQKIRDKDLSEVDRAKKETEEIRKDAEGLRLENAKLKALAKHGIPEDHQDLVHGTDAASFEASAVKIAALVARAAGAPVPPPKADPIPDSGTNGGGGSGNQDKSGGSVSAGRELYKSKHNKP